MQSKHFERKKLTMTLLVLSDKFENVLPSKLFYIQRTQAQTTHSSDFIDETHFEPENLSLKDLQQLQPEPWSDLISDDNISVNTIYNTLSSIQLNPLPFQVSVIISSMCIVNETSLAIIGSIKAIHIYVETDRLHV